MPCYNAAAYIDLFITNIAALNKAFDEVIFYDDASTDNTYALLKQKGVNVIQGGENRGPGYARNKLAEVCRSDWFHFHDIDDEMDADYLVKTSEIVKVNPVVDVVLCNVNWYDAQSGKLLLAWNYSHRDINENPVAYTIANPIGGINGLYRKSKFLQSGGFNTQIRIWEDADLHVKLASKKAIFYVIEEVLSKSLRYAESASNNQNLGWVTRLDLLTGYSKLFEDAIVRRQIGKQAQFAASNLILLGQSAEAEKALYLSELCNVKVPDNASKIWQILKWVLPSSIRINLRLFQLKKAFHK